MPKYSNILTIFYFPLLAVAIIWLIPDVDDCQCSSITKLEQKQKKEKRQTLDCTQLRKNSNCLPTCQEPYPLEPEQGGFEYQLACWLISLMHPQSFLQLKELCLLLHICEASKMPLLSGQKAAKKKKF